MIIDARCLPGGTHLNCDVVVVGTGPAGTSIAMQLAESGADIIVLEAGGEHYSYKTQRHFAGEIVNPDLQPQLNQYRIRQFGGGSNVWGGRCCPYDEIDFEPRSWVPGSGWPINHSILEPYYVRAHEFLDIGEFCYTAGECLDGDRRAPLPDMTWNKICDNKVWRYSPPTNFRKKYRKHLNNFTNARVLLYATCLELRSTTGNRITQALIATGQDRRISVSAKLFALAAGAIESARLLLLSRDKHPAGLGNGYDQVGRYFQTHMYGSVAKIRYLGNPRSVRFQYERSHDGIYVQHMLTVHPDVQREQHLLNFCAVLEHPDFHDPEHASAILSSMFLLKGLISHRLPAELARKALYHGGTGEFGSKLFGRHIWNVICDFDSMLPFSWDWLNRRLLAKRKLPSVKVYNKQGEYYLLYSSEQEPNAHSRVMLSDSTDSFGYNRVKSDWRYTDRDIDSIVENHRVIANDIEEARYPCVALDADFANLADRVKETSRLGSHHIGITRMSDDLRAGVVDSRCRVHDVSNLYIASSAVFPTSSCKSVTLLIVAIALRVADTILNELPHHDVVP